LSWESCIHDKKMKEVLKVATSIAVRKSTVMIYGESGVGKELLARHIHDSSQRSRQKFVAINCAALPENLLESELFGHEKGAFTDAKNTKVGLFEQADRGTFLLDEISELPLLLQGKILRILQESEVQKIGGLEPKKVDVRIICTSNRSLEKMVSEGLFRKDLYYRLNVIPLKIPALRSRKADILSIANYTISDLCKENELPEKKLTSGAKNALLNHSWRGNIRELRNVLERTILLTQNHEIRTSDLLFPTFENFDEKEVSEKIFKAGLTLQEAEKILIFKTLEQTSNNKTKAAEILGISIRTLRNKLNIYKVEAL